MNRRLFAGSALLATLASLAGCSSVGSVSGAAAGVASGGVTGNPAVGIAVGIGVRAVVDDSMDRLARRWSDEEQQSIATVAGGLGVGERRSWSVQHAVAYRNAEGQVQVVRAFQTPLAACKEALFSLSSDDSTAAAMWFATTVCQGPKGWQWAAAEPAVARWGALQ